MADEQLTLEQFGQKIKAKYPQYASFSDIDIANKVIAKYPQYKSSIKAVPEAASTPPAQDEDWRDKFTRMTPHTDGDVRELMTDPAAVAREVGISLRNISSGAASVLLHPVDTAVGMGKLFGAGMTGGALNPGVMAEQFGPLIESLRERPLETVEQGVGQAAVFDGLGEAVGPVSRGVIGPITRGLQEARTKLGEMATGTGPRATADLVQKTQAENAAGMEEHGKALKEHQEDVRNVRKSNVDALNEHLAKIDEIAKDKQAGHAIIDAREGLTKTVEDATKEADIRTEKARHDALEIGNEKYSGVNEALNGIESDPETVATAVDDAHEAIKGSNTKPAILEDIRKRMTNGTEALTYRDLQGYYSELGREISKGSLPGDVFHAYDTLHEAIGNEMQRIADSAGQGTELKAAREYWRRMKQTFGDTSDTVSDRAAKEVKEGNPGAAKAQVSEYRRRLLGSFDPEIPKLLDGIDRAASRLKELPGEDEGRSLAATKVPQPPDPTALPPKPTFEPQKIGTEDVRQAKAEAVHRTAKYLHQRALAFGAYAGAFKTAISVARAMTGDLSALASLPTDVAEGIGTMAGTHAIGSFIESPKMLKLLTEPTARDLAQIPPELRGDLKPLVEQAQKRGIKVDPKLAALVGAASGPVGPAQRKLQELRGQSSTSIQ